ncbi:energy transducer TonB [Brucepastera parasyntrophica]|uniref:energy transducer TonB n=1 Tax=Brucepastera parasyntrophica TaxID=2880008 RepID=UPI00210BEA5C|nr:energy transducer TonB [Brucepastera parasyntrophica]ULQ58869.1 energy transducer TonB [Brucepastera parasyntrophica]
MIEKEKNNITRLVSFIIVAALHLIVIFSLVFTINQEPARETEIAGVMKMVDIREAPPPPPLRETPPPETLSNTVEAVASTMIATEEPPPETVTSSVPHVLHEVVDFLPMSKISVLPVFPEDEIRRATVYPPIALRSGIEGTVYLELFVDRDGNIRDIKILKETPENRGFGEAAVNAFRGVKGKPAESNGQPVAVRYRYPVRFKIS